MLWNTLDSCNDQGIIAKSHGEVSLAEQETVKCVLAYLPKIYYQIFNKKLNIFFSFILYNFSVQTLQHV